MDSDTTPTPEVSDRPIQNLKGEFDRKFGSIEQKLNAVVGYIAQQEAVKGQQPPPTAKGKSKAELTDDELWELAKAGDKEAFDAHQERKAAQTYSKLRGIEQHQQLVTGQMNILAQKYPVLKDANHPLTQTANQAYGLLVQRGYPADADTLRQATLTAIADRPELVTEMYSQVSQAREGARRVSAGNPGVTGASHRQDPPAQGNKLRVTPEEAALAKRMNVLDPAKAKERFLQRRASGQSSLGAVGALIDDGEF